MIGIYTETLILVGVVGEQHARRIDCTLYSAFIINK